MLRCLSPITYTWRLWIALKSPPSDQPVHLWLSRSENFNIRLSGWFIGGVVIYYIAISLLLSAQHYGWSAYFAIITLGLPLMSLVLIFSGTTYGVIWTMRISSTLNNMQQTGIYDLLAVSPPGANSTQWLIATHIVHHDPTLIYIPALEMPVSRRGGWVLGGFFFIVLLLPYGRIYILPILLVANVIIGIYTDYVQSYELAMLIGIAVATRTSISRDIRVWTALIFLTLQIMTYGFFVAIVMIIFSGLHLSLLAFYGIPQLIIFYFMREPIIAFLLHYLDFSLEPKR